MKTSILATVAAAAMSLPLVAQAADMPYKMPVKAPPPAVFSWTGWYIGGNVGRSWWDDPDVRYTMPFTTPGNIFANCGTPTGATPLALTGSNPFGLSSRCQDSDSWVGGGQIGYNWQSGAMVYGIEADGMARHLHSDSFVRFGNNTTAGAPMGSVANDTAFFHSEQGAVGTLRARLGYAPSNWLLYVTGGLAVGHVEHSFTEVLDPGNTCTVISGSTCRNISDSKTKTGWTVGAGGEVALGMQWSLGVEYLFVDLGDTTLTLPPQGPSSPTNFFFNTSTARFDNTSHIARVKLNYRWGGAAIAY